VADAAVLLTEAGAHAARVPLVETDLLAGWLAHAAGISLPDGPLTAVRADLQVSGDRVAGVLHRVPWARAAAGLVVLTPAHVVLLTPDALRITDGTNLAEEPRDTVQVGTASRGVPAAAVTPAPRGAAGELRVRAALGRAQLLAGAARAALAGSVRYAGERHQFGRPLGKFQAIQMELAEMAGEVTAVTALTDAAVQAVERGENVVLACAAAKVRAGAAVEVVARLAHQVHGAIGFTQEHKLHHLTRRLWAWRDEAGSELAWSRVLGAGLLADGADGLWPALTRVV
jgi:acyl-CoA dehydrogenase